MLTTPNSTYHLKALVQCSQPFSSAGQKRTSQASERQTICGRFFSVILARFKVTSEVGGGSDRDLKKIHMGRKKLLVNGLVGHF
jgi:hypothetical protein